MSAPTATNHAAYIDAANQAGYGLEEHRGAKSRRFETGPTVSITDRISQAVGHLPPEKQREVLAYAQALAQSQKEPSAAEDIIGAMADDADALDEAVVFAMQARQRDAFRAEP